MDRYFSFIPDVYSDESKLQDCFPGELSFFLNIQTMTSVINFDYSLARGVLMMRHPLDVLVSSHRFHLTAKEKWLLTLQDNGLTYQEELNTLSTSEGLLHELTKGPMHGDTKRLLGFLKTDAAQSLTRLKLEMSKYAPEEFSDALSDALGLDPKRMRSIVVEELSYENFQQYKHLSTVDNDLIDKIRRIDLHGAQYPYEFSLHLECVHYMAFEEHFGGINALRSLGYGDSVEMYNAAKRNQCDNSNAREKKRRRRRRRRNNKKTRLNDDMLL